MMLTWYSHETLTRWHHRR